MKNDFIFQLATRYSLLIYILLCIVLLAAWNYLQPTHVPQWIDLLAQALIMVTGMIFLMQHFQKKTLQQKTKNYHSWHLLPSAFDILEKQLHNGMSNSETAVMTAIERMVHIQSISNALHQEASTAVLRTREITQEMQQLSTQSKEALSNFLEQQHLLSELQLKKDENIAQAMQDITQFIGPLVDVIRNIAQQTQLLSFNAAIEAARAGPEGNGFKVLATSVRELAQKTVDAAKQIDDGISSVQKAASLNSVNYSKEIAQTLQSMQKMHMLLEMNMKHSTTLLPFLLELSHNMDQGTSEIKSHVLDVLGQMQFQDRLKQILEQLKNGLGTLSNYSSATIHEKNIHSEMEEILKSWQENYVTLGQRLAHASATQSETKDQEKNEGLKIDLF